MGVIWDRRFLSIAKPYNIIKLFLGDQKNRTEKYKNFLISLLKRKNVSTVLDAACGTGVDSVMLVEEVISGFHSEGEYECSINFVSYRKALESL